MITAAHIGVGINGLEGSQASNSADYAIAQFRFLKDLMLAHGRENYRRNSVAIGYIFYKNVLLVIPAWAFGFFSFFSGTDIYDLSLANTYNVFFTSIPIIWYATFDKEYEKKVLLKRPHLYHIGLDNNYFSFSEFFRWVFYASWQAIMILLCILFTIAYTSPNYVGKMGDLSLVGGLALTCIIMLVNLKVLLLHNTFDVWVFIWIPGSFILYLIAYYVLSATLIATDIFGTFFQLAMFPETYFTMLVVTISYVLIDIGFRYTNSELNLWTRKRKAHALQKQKEKDLQDETIVRSRVSFHNSKYNKCHPIAKLTHVFVTATARGYAFSQAKGNDVLVTDRLQRRISNLFFGQTIMGRQSEFMPANQRPNNLVEIQGQASINEPEYERSESSSQFSSQQNYRQLDVIQEEVDA